MNWPIWILSFLLIGAPTGALMLDRIKGYPVRRFVKTQGLPALIVFVAVMMYGYVNTDPIIDLITWGLVGGLVCTIALDAIRLIGVKLGQFPMDMPTMFGTIASGIAPKMMKNVMANLVGRVAEMPGEERRRMLSERINWLAEQPEEVRRFVMGGMMKGLRRLSEDKRSAVMGTQIEILSSLPTEKRAVMMRTMDALLMGISHTGQVVEKPPLLRHKPPQIPMNLFRELAKKALPQTLEEEGVSLAKVWFWGYLWHFINGATYGIGYTLLFGMGSWPLVFAWCIFVDLVMMVSMPRMMPMIKLPFPRFLIVPYFAHLAMAIPIGYFALTYITPQVTISASLLGPYLLSPPIGDTSLTLVTGPIAAIAVMTATIVFGYKVYGKPY